ncbi:MAG: flagellin [Candidatus Rifleibacteriota bacterium]
MSLRINQNVLSIQTYGNLTQTSNRLEKSIEKLSSGLRINKAADDAAGLAISEKMRRQIRGLNRAVLNAQDGISMIQTAEGALNETHSILHRMRELAIQSSNDTLTSNDRLEIQKEVVQLKDDLNRIARNTEFNTKKLLDGSQTALISSSSNYIKGIVSGYPKDSAGDYDVSIALLSAGISQMQRSQIFTINDENANLAQGTTQLQSISQFYNSNGVFILDTPLALTINGNSRTTSIQLDAQMTVDNVAAAIQNAIGSESGLGIKNSKTSMVNTAQTGIAGLGGYLEVISGSIGESGEISFCGDQQVVDALGLSVSRAAENNRVEMTLRDSFGNLRQIKTESNRGVGLLNGIDINFESQAAQIAGISGLESGLYFSSAETFYLNVGGDSVQVSVQAGYWTMEGLARSFNHQILTAIDNGASDLMGLSAAVVEGEIRFSYDRPATAAASVGTAIRISSSTNSVLGFLNGTYSGFVDGQKDSTKIEWGFTTYRTDLTLQGDSVDLKLSDGVNTVTLRVITAISTSAAGSVTAADMIRFINFQATINDQLTQASVAVRVDQIGGTMAFTSLRVGTQNLDAAAAYTSMISLEVTDTAGGTVSAGDSFMLQMGMSEGTTKGAGDKNFRLHVVNNTPQFQIGADQGQNMEVSMSDMSAAALEVDKLDLTTVAGSQRAIGKLNRAIDMVSAERSKLGAFQNRLEYAINNLRSTHSNLSSAESRIRDADIANEMIEFTRNQIVSQSGTAMLAQANLIPQGVLQLLQ